MGLSVPQGRFLERADKATGQIADLRCEAGRREVESQQNADDGVPEAQSRVPAQQDDHPGQDESYRQGHTQLITPFRSCAMVYQTVDGQPSASVVRGALRRAQRDRKSVV